MGYVLWVVLWKCTCIGYHQTGYATSFRLCCPPMSMRSAFQKCRSSYLRLHTAVGTWQSKFCISENSFLVESPPSLDTRCLFFSFISAASMFRISLLFCTILCVLLYPSHRVEIPELLVSALLPKWHQGKHAYVNYEVVVPSPDTFS